MSLLMDALRKAEESKRRAEENASPEAAAPELTLTPMAPMAPLAPPVPPASPRPEFAEESNSADPGLWALASDSPLKPPERDGAQSSSARAQEAAERSAARNVFSAKQPGPSRRALWPALATLVGVVALGLGAYFWWQMQSISGGLRPVPVQAQAQPPAAALAPAPLSATLPATAQAAEALLETARLAPSSAPRAAPESAATGAARTRRLAPDSSPVAQSPPLRLNKTQTSLPLEQAYAGLQAGRLDEAQRDYEQVLSRDEKNTDALLGLATVAARQGQLELAQGYYQRALESDPNDATAQAGVLNTRGQSDPGLSESRLKSALAAQPDSAPLHFTLGNLYARQARWSEAQQAYFRAYAGDPENADFLFNLAVSLDHLRQNRLAVQYYQMALNAGQAETVSFDRRQVRNRILELQP